MVAEALDALRRRFPECEMAAFADISTQMILVTDSQSDLPREQLDALCQDAARLLSAKGLPVLGDKPARSAVRASSGKLFVFVRSAQEPTDVLCCQCGCDIAVDAFLSAARDTMQQIG